MSDVLSSNVQPIITQQIKFLNLYIYHVVLIISGIMLVGAPLVYSSKIGRSRILSGIMNFDLDNFGGYCYPFNKPTSGEGYENNSIGDGVEAEGFDSNYLITDEISFFVSYHKCITNLFKGGGDSQETISDNTTTNEQDANSLQESTLPDNNSICKVTYGKIIQFDYDYVKNLLTPSNNFLKKMSQIHNYIQYLRIGKVATLSDEVITKQYGEASYGSYFLSMVYFIFFELPLDIFRSMFVFALILYNFIFGTILFQLTSYIYIPPLFIETILLFFPSVLLLLTSADILIILMQVFFGVLSIIFVIFFIILFIFKFAVYIYFIFKTYSEAADKVDLAFIYMKLFIYIGAIIMIMIVIGVSFWLILFYSITIYFFSFFIMLMIIIFCLFFKANEVDKDGIIDKSKNYSYFTFLKGLIYKQSWILLLLLIVLICDIFYCKIVKSSSITFGTIFGILIVLMFIGYFNNTLKFKDESHNSFFSNLQIINKYDENELDKNMIRFNKELYDKYSTIHNLKCNAKFNDTTILENVFNFKSWSLYGFFSK